MLALIMALGLTFPLLIIDTIRTSKKALLISRLLLTSLGGLSILLAIFLLADRYQGTTRQLMAMRRCP